MEIGEASLLDFEQRAIRFMTSKQTKELKSKPSYSSTDEAIDRKMAASRNKNVPFTNLPVIPPVETRI